jgi:hypothetical protein
MVMKGYLYTIEVLIATSIVFIAVGMAFKSPAIKPAMETELIGEQGFLKLQYLDVNGTLRELVMNRNETGLESALALAWPYEVSFSCDDRNLPENKTVITTVYYVVGEKHTYNYTKICLYSWEYE